LPLLSTNFCTRGTDTLYSTLLMLIRNQLEYSVLMSVAVRIEFIFMKLQSNWQRKGRRWRMESIKVFNLIST
jgi:hypothetical protein